MNEKIEGILGKFELGEDGIYSYSFINDSQGEEVNLRKKVAGYDYDEYLPVISRSHSIPVMDAEVNSFLEKIPENGIIVDVGGCWGWHWRRINKERPDVIVVVVDFIRENLQHAKKLLKEMINRNVYLVHGDALSLNFDQELFDGYWTVQTLQHIPDYKKAIEESYRVLKPGGVFCNYSLNNQPLIRWVYRVLGREYVVQGRQKGSFYLSRASDEQLFIVREKYGTVVNKRYSEILFKPELGISFSGRESSIVGAIDRFLTGDYWLASLVARQQSYHTEKLRKR